MEESSDSSESSTSSIDYDALLFEGDDELVGNLRRVWSMYLDVPEASGEEDEDEDDIELDVDYDALVDGEGRNRSVMTVVAKTIIMKTWRFWLTSINYMQVDSIGRLPSSAHNYALKLY